MKKHYIAITWREGHVLCGGCHQEFKTRELYEAHLLTLDLGGAA